MSDDTATLDRYQHTPGNPVLDRTSALLAVRNHGKLGNAIAAADEAIIHATGEPCLVVAVDHSTGEVAVQPAGGGHLVLAGYELVVTVPAHHEAVPDDHLEGMTIDQARTAMVALASDLGRYPQYGPGFFDSWVFARAVRAVKHRGETILVRGQRLLVRLDSVAAASAGPVTCTAWITRTEGISQPGRSILVEARHITFEECDHAHVVAAILNANRALR
jgi:hypothetical protein